MWSDASESAHLPSLFPVLLVIHPALSPYNESEFSLRWNDCSISGFRSPCVGACFMNPSLHMTMYFMFGCLLLPVFFHLHCRYLERKYDIVCDFCRKHKTILRYTIGAILLTGKYQRAIGTLLSFVGIFQGFSSWRRWLSFHSSVYVNPNLFAFYKATGTEASPSAPSNSHHLPKASPPALSA